MKASKLGTEQEEGLKIAIPNISHPAREHTVIRNCFYMYTTVGKICQKYRLLDVLHFLPDER